MPSSEWTAGLPSSKIDTICSSFLRQKNSRSRVNATFKFFYAFAKLNHIETYVQELVACFGVPGGEHELGPPACRFQWRPCDSGPVDFYLGGLTCEETS